MRSRWLILPLGFLCTAQMQADSVVLVTGERISGTIKAETPTEITIDVPVSAAITDERVIQKTDISKIEKEQPDELAYKQLIQIQPSTELSYSSQSYDQILASLAAFEAKYPNSSYLAEIKKLAATFQQEKKYVDSGEVKFMGQWLSKDEASRRSIQIEGLEYYHTMQQQAGAGDLVGAMQTFDTLEHSYGTTSSYVPAVALAQQVIGRLQQDLVVRMEQVKADQAQLQKTIAFTAEPEKSSIIADAKTEQDRANAAVDAAVRSGAKWVPLIPRSQVSIDTLQKVAASEAQRLSSIPVAAMTESLQKVDAARNAISAGDLKTADILLTTAGQLWNQNEAAHYWMAILKQKTASPSPGPGSSGTPKPLPVVPLSVATSHAAAANLAATAAPATEDKPFYMTISGALSIAAVALVVGVIATVINQKKARKVAE